MKKKLRILIVDDSVLFRSQIQTALSGIPQLEVVGAVSNGKLALEKLPHLEIDLLILDLEMPVMDGLETLRELRKIQRPPKVIMFSSVSISNGHKTLEAMNLGALDFVPKPGIENGLKLTPAQKIRESLEAKLDSLFFSKKDVPLASLPRRAQDKNFCPEVLVIASSTGGPNALADLFEHLREPLPFPILITQHMPAVFTTSLAARLGQISGKKSCEAVDGEKLEANRIYLAPGNFHMHIRGTRQSPVISLDQGELRNFVRPCADYLFESAAQIFGKSVLGVVLTGMGRDGFDGSKAISSGGGSVFIQDQASSVVFGMPGAIFESGSYDFCGNIPQLAARILYLSQQRKGSHVA